MVLPLILLLALLIGLSPRMLKLAAQPPGLFTNQSHTDPSLFTYSDSRGIDFIQGNDIADFYLLHLSLYTIDCARPSLRAVVYGMVASELKVMTS